MRPNKEPVPSPSDMRAARGEDRPGASPEDRTPSPSDLASDRRIRVDGDRTTSTMQDPRNADSPTAAGGTRPALPAEAVYGNQQEPLKQY